MRKRFYTKSLDVNFSSSKPTEVNETNEVSTAADNKYYTVCEVNSYIHSKFKSDDNLTNIYIRGEISNYKTYPSGHSYFTLKEKDSQIPSVMFHGFKSNLKFEPKDGMKVVIRGNVEVYVPYGRYQLVAHQIIEDGVGELHIAYEQLKKKLDAEGLFDESHKKEIVKYPKKIGVVTARTGAAIRDIITTIKRRYPYCQVLVFSTLVQGDQAADNISKQIVHAQEYDLDTLIVGRGGGSIEDLWPFNEEKVARAIYDCSIPVISAVGHEIDFTISDFVADLRAATPTAAAELAVPNILEIKSKLNHLNERLVYAVDIKLMENRTKLKNISNNQIFRNPDRIYDVKKMNLDLILQRFDNVSKDIITINKNRLFKLENSHVLKNPRIIVENKKDKYIRNVSKLEVLNPLLTLKRGYTITKNKDKVISSSKDVKVGDELEIDFDDGSINAKVI